MSAVPLKAWLEKDGALLRLGLSRPKANIVDGAMIAGLRSAVREDLPGGGPRGAGRRPPDLRRPRGDAGSARDQAGGVRPRGLLPAAGADRPGSRGGPPLLGGRHRGGGGG